MVKMALVEDDADTNGCDVWEDNNRNDDGDDSLATLEWPLPLANYSYL